MNKSKLRGIGVVFKQNLRIHMKSKKYVVSTILVGIVLLLGMTALMFLVNKKQADKADYDYTVKEVYVVDETGLGVPDYALIAEMIGLDYGKDTNFIVCNQTAQEVISKPEVQYMIVQTVTDEAYEVQVVSGSDIDVKKGQLNKNLDCLEEIVQYGFQNHVYMNSGMTEEQLMQAVLPVTTNVVKLGDKTEEDKQMIVFIASFLSVMIAYFMILLYGSEICSDVPMEKTSKLVEQLLMSVSSTALVCGKIFAKIVSCTIQFIIWVLSIVIGVIGGDAVARQIFGLEDSTISKVVDFIQKVFAGSGFTLPTIVLAVILSLVGMSLYLLLAGLGGSMLTKPEQAANIQTIFVLPLVASFMILMFGSGIANGSADISIVYYMVPFTATLVAPAGVLLGTLSIPMACVSLGISLVTCAIIIVLAAKIYEGLLFFNGNKLTVKDVIRAVKSK